MGHTIAVCKPAFKKQKNKNKNKKQNKKKKKTMKMDKNIFTHFITIFYSTKSCNANAQRRVLVSLFTKLKPSPYGLACFPLANLITTNVHELF